MKRQIGQSPEKAWAPGRRGRRTLPQIRFHRSIRLPWNLRPAAPCARHATETRKRCARRECVAPGRLSRAARCCGTLHPRCGQAGIWCGPSPSRGARSAIEYVFAVFTVKSSRNGRFRPFGRTLSVRLLSRNSFSCGDAESVECGHFGARGRNDKAWRRSRKTEVLAIRSLPARSLLNTLERVDVSGHLPAQCSAAVDVLRRPVARVVQRVLDTVAQVV